jgi:exonuclease VII small subunit
MSWGRKNTERIELFLDNLAVKINRLEQTQVALTEAVKELVRGNQETIKFLAQQADAIAAESEAHAAELKAEHRDAHGRFTKRAPEVGPVITPASSPEQSLPTD